MNDFQSLLTSFPYGEFIEVLSVSEPPQNTENEVESAYRRVPYSYELDTVIGRKFENEFTNQRVNNSVVTSLLTSKKDSISIELDSPFQAFSFGTTFDDIRLEKNEVLEKQNKIDQSKQAHLINAVYSRHPPEPTKVKETLSNRKDQEALFKLAEDYANQTPVCVCNGVVYYHNGLAWKQLTPEKLALQMSISTCNFAMPYLDPSDYKKIIFYLRINGKLQLDDREAIPPPNLVNLLDCVYDILSGEFLEKRETWFFRTYLCASSSDILHDSGNDVERFMYSITNGNTNHRQLLFEVIGVCLSRYHLKYFFLAIGPTDSGKSLFGTFLSELVGNDNCHAINDLNELTDKFALSPFADVNLTLGLDLPDVIIKKKTVSIVKMLCGNDLVKAEAKFTHSFTFKNEAKMFLSTNYGLRVNEPERESAFYNRLVIVPFLNSIRKQEQDTNLLSKLLDQKGYVLEQAFAALRSLVERNFQFTQVEIPNESFLHNQVISTSKSPGFSEILNQFVSEKCIIGDELQTLVSDLYEEFACFCSDGNYTSTNNASFSRLLASNFPKLIPYRQQGTELRGYKGIALKQLRSE